MGHIAEYKQIYALRLLPQPPVQVVRQPASSITGLEKELKSRAHYTLQHRQIATPTSLEIVQCNINAASSCSGLRGRSSKRRCRSKHAVRASSVGRLWCCDWCAFTSCLVPQAVAQKCPIYPKKTSHILCSHKRSERDKPPCSMLGAKCGAGARTVPGPPPMEATRSRPFPHEAPPPACRELGLVLECVCVRKSCAPSASAVPSGATSLGCMRPACTRRAVVCPGDTWPECTASSQRLAKTENKSCPCVV